VTAEVGVLNSIGVALAADSAVSIGKDANKIYTSANKIFQLSCVEPVGVMIYGNSNLVGVPWETIIKIYRKQLGKQQFDTLEEYAEDYIAFLKAPSHGMFTQKRQDRHAGLVVYSLFDELRDSLWIQVQNEMRAGKEDIKEDDIDELLHELVKRFLADKRAKDLLPGFSKADIATAESTYQDEIEEAVKSVFKAELPQKTKRALKKLGAETLCRQEPGALSSGIVIAGFGDREFMPSLVTYEIEEMALGQLRHVAGPSVTHINEDTTAVVKPFAQQEMVHSFMTGIEPRLLDFMHGSTADLFEGVVKDIFDLVSGADPQLGKNLEKAVGPKLPDLVKKLFDGWREEREKIWKPVLRITGSLPKDELAAMAEALVNLTKFRRRVTTDRETVGGPIDVAVITKGDGFVWTKRKHYFSPEYNPRVIARFQ